MGVSRGYVLDHSRKAEASLSCWDGSSGLLDSEVQATDHATIPCLPEGTGKGGKVETGRQQRSRKRLETSKVAGAPEHQHPALGAERKEPGICGSGESGLVRGWPKVTSRGDTEQAFKQALGTSAC